MVYFTGNFLICRTMLSISNLVNWKKFSYITEVSPLITKVSASTSPLLILKSVILLYSCIPFHGKYICITRKRNINSFSPPIFTISSGCNKNWVTTSIEHKILFIKPRIDYSVHTLTYTHNMYLACRSSEFDFRINWRPLSCALNNLKINIHAELKRIIIVLVNLRNLMHLHFELRCLLE